MLSEEIYREGFWKDKERCDGTLLRWLGWRGSVSVALVRIVLLS